MLALGILEHREVQVVSVSLSLDDYDLQGALSVMAGYGQSSFDFVVTPNVDHVIRYCDDAHFRELYGQARYVLLDSRLLAGILKLTRRQQLKVCTGSDLTAALFSVIAAHDRIVLIGSSARQAEQLAQRFGLRELHHYDPPMGFVRDPVAIEQALQFVEAHSPFRFCFLAVGSPQQEVLATELKRRGVARGLGLCIGASINFMTGVEERAPLWMQRLNLEWLYRLLQDPGRMAKRYLWRGPRIFALLPRIRFEPRRARVSGDGTASRALPE
jgi:exopolysaccharide biosynthesis WecB/TagA/CpsF family protein